MQTCAVIPHLEAVHEGSQVCVLDALWNWHPHRDRALHIQYIYTQISADVGVLRLGTFCCTGATVTGQLHCHTRVNLLT